MALLGPELNSQEEEIAWERFGENSRQRAWLGQVLYNATKLNPQFCFPTSLALSSSLETPPNTRSVPNSMPSLSVPPALDGTTPRTTVAWVGEGKIVK